MHWLLSTMLVFSLTVQGAAPRRETQGLSQVPPQLRAQLLESLQQYINYERQQDYGRLYDLLSDKVKNPEYLKRTGGESPIQTKSGYIRFRKAYFPKVLDFTPQSLRYSRVARYEIRGQATLRYRGGTSKQERILYVWREDDKWLFSELNEEIID